MNELDEEIMRIGRRGRSWVVEGDGSGWLFERTYPTRWKAKLAIDVFKEGGRASDYFRRARLRKQGKDTYVNEDGRPGKRGWNKRVRKLQERIHSDPNDAEAYLELALQLASRNRKFPKVTSTTNATGN